MSNSEREANEVKRQTGVVGAAGFVGSAVMRALRNASEDAISLVPRALVHDAECNAKAKAGLSDAPMNPIFRRLEFHDARTFAPVMYGLKRLFLMRPPAIGNVERQVFPLLDVAVKTGVERIAFLSVAGAETRAYLPHAKIEARLALLARRAALTRRRKRPQ